MSIDRFELLELRRDDGVQTYHARDVATKRPVQVHLFANGNTRESLALLAKVAFLPEAERRRVIDRGMSGGRPYVVTDRLAGFASLREWLELKTSPTIDQQFFQLFEESAPAPEPVVPAGEPRKSAPILAMVLGVGAAILFLALLIVFVAFRPHGQ